MAAKRQAEATMTIADAVATLSSIAELDLEGEVGVAEDKQLELQGHEVQYRLVHWLKAEESEEPIIMIRKTFRAVLDYLQSYFESELKNAENGEKLEGVKTVMALVGEAAKKVDRFTNLFQATKVGRCVNLREYKALQRFYKTKLAKRIEGDQISHWIRRLPNPVSEQARSVKLRGKRASSAKHVYVDLDTVMRDTDYELFFIRKKDGGRFFHPKLVRNVQLVCDFGGRVGNTTPIGQDTITVEKWADKAFHVAAHDVLMNNRNMIEQFYQVTSMVRNRELVGCVSKALMALFLCANPGNLLHNRPAKCCREYFADFQVFLRDALSTRHYRKFLAYPPKADNEVGHVVMEVLQGLCDSIYSMNRSLIALAGVTRELSDYGRKGQRRPATNRPVSEYLIDEYQALGRAMMDYSRGPLRRLLETLQESKIPAFDPWLLGNIPRHMYDLFVGRHRVAVLGIPTPTWQESIDKAYLTNEFRGFLTSYSKGTRKRQHLMFNLQDRTSWREHTRCKAIEETQNSTELKKVLTVVTLPKDTDFYHQLTPYHNLNHASRFMEQFLEHLQDTNSGFFFPSHIGRRLFGRWAQDMMSAIHEQFFDSRNVLMRSERLDFIEIAYTLIQLKVIELVNPDSMSLTCKDAIDVGGIASAQMYLLQQLWSGRGVSAKDREYMEQILWLPAILNRERMLLPERFDRMLAVVKRFEEYSNGFSAGQIKSRMKKSMGSLFKKPVLTAKVIPPHEWS